MATTIPGNPPDLLSDDPPPDNTAYVSMDVPAQPAVAPEATGASAVVNSTSDYVAMEAQNNENAPVEGSVVASVGNSAQNPGNAPTNDLLAQSVSPSDALSPVSGDVEASSNYISMDIVSDHPPRPGEATGDEDDNDEGSKMSRSIVSSVLTADGIHDPMGFACVCLVILIGDMSRGVFFPSMWPLVEYLGGNTVLLGYSVAAFSFGRILVNPIFGSWSHTYGYTKTLLTSCIVLFIGTITYAQVYRVGSPQFLIVAQTILGVGSGTLGVTRAFVADVTAQRHRTTYMAWMTAVQYGGFTVTPIFGALFNWIYRDQVINKDAWLQLNMFTAPAYFMSFVTLTTIFVLLTCFQGRQRIDIRKEEKKEKKSLRRQEMDRVAHTTTFIGLTVYECCILGCMLLNIATKGSIAAFETMGIALAESHFQMASSQAGLIVGMCGAIGVVALLQMGRLAEYFTDVQLIGGGMMIMAAGVALLTTLNENENVILENPPWKYVVAMFLLYATGYPIGHTAVIGLFSKIVGRRPQGTLLGWFASAGSLARMFFPIASGYIINYWTIENLFAMLVVVLVVSTGFVAYTRDTLTLLSN